MKVKRKEQTKAEFTTFQKLLIKLGAFFLVFGSLFIVMVIISAIQWYQREKLIQHAEAEQQQVNAQNVWSADLKVTGQDVEEYNVEGMTPEEIKELKERLVKQNGEE